jgi:hypothetical protein
MDYHVRGGLNAKAECWKDWIKTNCSDSRIYQPTIYWQGGSRWLKVVQVWTYKLAILWKWTMKGSVTEIGILQLNNLILRKSCSLCEPFTFIGHQKRMSKCCSNCQMYSSFNIQASCKWNSLCEISPDLNICKWTISRNKHLILASNKRTSSSLCTKCHVNLNVINANFKLKHFNFVNQCLPRGFSNVLVKHKIYIISLCVHVQKTSEERFPGDVARARALHHRSCCHFSYRQIFSLYILYMFIDYHVTHKKYRISNSNLHIWWKNQFL